MIKLKQLFTIFLVLSFGALLTNNVSADSEVTLSGSTWTAITDGNTVYTGSSFFDAVNAACNNEGAGTINIRNSGSSGPGGSNIYAISPRSDQTLDFHGQTINCNGNDLVVGIRADRKSNITVKNVNVTGYPRYGFWFTGCNSCTFTNITMNITSGLGIRYSGRDNYSSNLTINGNINIHSVGHSIETYSVYGVSIDKVTVTSDNGCGVLFNDSENCTVNEIWAYNCDPGGSYAGFRQANDNGTTYCGFLRAKGCGRGLYVITSSHSTTIGEVDIDDCTTSGISVTGTAYNVRVNSGTVSNTPKAVDLWDGYSDVCIQVNGGSYGDACSSGGGSTGTYQIQNRNTGLYIDGIGRTANGSNCGQWSSSSSNNQKWAIESSGSYVKLKNVATGLYLDGMGRTSDGSAAGQWSSSSSYNQQWAQESSGSYVKFRNRATGLYLDGMGLTSNGSDLGQWSSSSHYNQQWSLISTKSTIPDESTANAENYCTIYPTAVDNMLNITLMNGMENGAMVYLYNSTGQMMLSENIVGENNSIDISGLAQGIYFIKVSNDKEVVNKSIIKK